MSLDALDTLRQDLERMSFIEGRLCVSPSSLSLPYPFGGTDLGTWARIVATWKPIRFEATAQEWYGRKSKIYRSGFVFTVGALLRSGAVSAWAQLFPGVTADTQTGVPGFAETIDTERAVELATVPLLFCPDAMEDYPAIYIPAAWPLVELVAAVSMSINNEAQVPAAFEAAPDSTGRLYQRKLIKSITL